MTFNGTLHPFQSEAVDMMLDRTSLLLALDLGLGKTVTSIAACEELIDAGEAQCVLVICPASIKWQWYHQIQKFSDGALAKVIEGAKGDRRVQYHAVKRGDVEYVIMNYEQVVADWDVVRHLAFDVIVCDEITALKNPGTKRSRHIKRLTAPYKFGLSGQPIENRPEELFSIMEWVDATVLGDSKRFDATFIRRNRYGGVRFYRNLPVLRKAMGTSMFRKTRRDVRDQLPSVVENSYIIDFDPATEKVYRRIVAELVDVIRNSPKMSTFNLSDHYSGIDDGGAMGEVMPRLMALRMICNHPGLLSISADQFDDPAAIAGSAYASELKRTGVIGKLPDTSQKLAVTLEVIQEILDADSANKIVLFSFFKPMLRIISESIGVESRLFTGDQTPRERDEAVGEFTNNPDCRVLLSSDAGGIGLDLPAANFLISYDLPWSAGKFEQRNGRIIRISSKWPEVTLLSMLMRDSIEERMYSQLEEKGAIASAWLDGDGVTAKGEFHLTIGTLAEFLEDRS